MIRDNAEKTIVAQSRMDIRVLASLHRFYLNGSVSFANRSALIAAICEDFLRILEREGMAKRFESTASALQYLEHSGVIRSLEEEPSHRALLEKIQAESVKGVMIDIEEEEVDEAMKRFTVPISDK